MGSLSCNSLGANVGMSHLAELRSPPKPSYAQQHALVLACVTKQLMKAMKTTMDRAVGSQSTNQFMDSASRKSAATRVAQTCYPFQSCWPCLIGFSLPLIPKGHTKESHPGDDPQQSTKKEGGNSSQNSTGNIH